MLVTILLTIIITIISTLLIAGFVIKNNEKLLLKWYSNIIINEYSKLKLEKDVIIYKLTNIINKFKKQLK